jgi:hypothetical protein
LPVSRVAGFVVANTGGVKVSLIASSLRAMTGTPDDRAPKR